MVPIAVCMRWFPTVREAAVSFGSGAPGWIKLAGGSADLIERFGIDRTFAIYGAIFAMLVLSEMPK